MISFDVLTPDTNGEILEKLMGLISEADENELSELLDSFGELISEGDVEVGITAACGTVLVRIFDMGRYCFVYPISMCANCDDAGAIDAVRAYAVKEELPLVFVDVPSDCLGDLITSFRHTVVDASDETGECYRVEVKSECALLEDLPEVSGEGITLTPLCESDTADYARLCRDAAVNKYWGYDYRDDAPNAPDSYFLLSAEREFAYGSALTLAVREGETLVGEATLHAFDLLGGAEISFRILPEYQGRGLGKKTLTALTGLASDIGLVRIHARVDTRNAVSLHIVSRVMDEVSRNGGIVRFALELYG